MMSLDDFAVLAGAVQSLIVSIAIVIGGGWALYQFISLNSIAKSKAELESIKQSLESSGILEIEFEHKIIPHPMIDLGKCLLCTIHIKNVGSRAAVIEPSKTSLVATALSFDKDEHITALDNKLVGFWYFDQDQSWSTIAAGTSLDLHFVILLPKAGIYGLNFETSTPYWSEFDPSQLKSIPPHLKNAELPTMQRTLIYIQ